MTKRLLPVPITRDLKPFEWQDDPIYFSSHGPIRLSKEAQMILDNFIEDGDLKKAMTTAGLIEPEIRALFKDENFLTVLRERTECRTIKRNLDEDWWLHKMYKIATGDGDFKAREQLDALKSLGDRVMPKPERSAVKLEQPIININMGAVEASEKRRDIIDAINAKVIGEERKADD